MTKNTNKGTSMEELLRYYFDSSGSYAVRGAYLKVEGSDITDIDIWIYNKSSPITRERINVDCKNKKSSQARERIVWTKGIQKILKTDKCIVATRDKSPQIKTFGFQNNVMVMTGDFISNLYSSSLINQNKRLSEEEFYGIITSKGVKRGSRNFEWKSILEGLKSDLICNLSFSGINKLIYYAGMFLNESIISSPLQKAALRSLYAVMSYLMIQLDYAQLETLFTTDAEREKFYEEGFQYGKNGRQYLVEVSEIISSLPIFKDGPNIMYELDRNFDNSSFKILSEYFSKRTFLKSAFEQAKQFDNLSRTKNENELLSINKNLMSSIFVLCDFHRLDRVKFPVNIN